MFKLFEDDFWGDVRENADIRITPGPEWTVLTPMTEEAEDALTSVAPEGSHATGFYSLAIDPRSLPVIVEVLEDLGFTVSN